MNATCSSYRESATAPGRCGHCGVQAGIHADRAITAREVAERLSNTFDPGGSIDISRPHAGWVHSHNLAIDSARAVLEASPVGTALEIADRWQAGVVAPITPGEMSQELASQVEALRELENADEDIEAPDRQARDRLIKIAGAALAFAEQIDRRFAIDRTSHTTAPASATTTKAPKKRKTKRQRDTP